MGSFLIRAPSNAPLPLAAPGWLVDWLSRHRGRSIRTAQEYAHAVGIRAAPVLALVEAGRAREIGPGAAEQVAAALRKRYNPSAVNVTLSALSSLWRELERQEMVDRNPWRDVGRETPRETMAERILTEEEAERIIAAAPPGPARILVRTLYRLGARASELAGLRDDGRPGLRWRDVGTDRVTLFGKGQKTRIVHVDPGLIADLRRLPGSKGPDDPVFIARTGRPMLRQDVGRTVREAAKAAGVRAPTRPVSTHWLRHSHVTHALRAGAPIHVVQQTVGHASLETTGRYAHLIGDESSVGYVGSEGAAPPPSAPRGQVSPRIAFRVRAGRIHSR